MYVATFLIKDKVKSKQKTPVPILCISLYITAEPEIIQHKNNTYFTFVFFLSKIHFLSHILSLAKASTHLLNSHNK